MAYPISDVTRRIIYSGSAGTGPYSFAFEILDQTDIAVYKNTTLLTLTTDYSVSINVDGTGSVTLVTPAVAADDITLIGARAIERTTDFVTGGDLFANSLNDELDAQTIFAQQQQDEINRSMKMAPWTNTAFNTQLPDPLPNHFLAFNATADGFQSVTGSELAGLIAYATPYADTFTGDGSTVSWTLTRPPINLLALDVSIDGVTQVPTTNYTVSGTTFTMTSAPPVNSVILVRYAEYLPPSSGDSAGIRYIPAGTGAVNTNVQAKLRESVSVLDFGADPTGSIDSHDAFDNAIKTGGRVYVPPGTYLINSPIVLTNSFELIGSGQAATQIHRNYSPTVDTDGIFNFVDGATTISMRDMYLRSLDGQSGGCLISMVNTTSSFGQFTFTNMGFSTTGIDTHDYTIYMDGTASSVAPIGIRGVDMFGCSVFGGSVSCILVKGVLKFSFLGGGVYTAGATESGGFPNVRFDGTTTVPTQSFTFQPADCSAPLSFDYATLGNFSCGIMGHVTNTSNTSYIIGSGYSASVDNYWTNSVFTNPQSGMIFDRNAKITNNSDPASFALEMYGQITGFAQAGSVTRVGQTGVGYSFACPDTNTFSFNTQSGKMFWIATGGGAATLVFADYKSATIALVANPSGEFQASSTPGAGYTGIFKNTNSHTVSVKNNTGATVYYSICVVGSATNTVDPA